MIRFSVLIALCLACCFVGVISQSCTTPRQERGSCIPIKNCDVLYKLVQQRPVSQANVDYLKQSHCGFEGNLPKVCCPSANDDQTGGAHVNLPGVDVCGLDPGKRIIGGVETHLKEFGWMALLEYQKPNGRGFNCGGSLINNRYVLTAAHCVSRIRKTWKLVSVRLGEHQLNTDPDCEDSRPGFEYCGDSPLDIPVEEIITHDQYLPRAAGQAHDIALLRLSKSVVFTDYISPICLPTASHPLSEYGGLNMTVSGWGRTETRGQSNIKMKLEVPVQTQNECVSRYSQSKVTLGAGQICAGGLQGQDSCTGDSGGPLMYLNKVAPEYNYYLNGVVSFGPDPCGMKDWPGVYTNVAHYLPWIRRNIRP